MGKKSKIGKNRRDKYYALAKESGYRSRASFKLLQLNQSYNFLENAKVCIDLCAAPGGWLQVASKYMPVASLIIGVDLFAIKPIRNVKTLCSDITTDKCKYDLKKCLGQHAADIVLHDGAPNMGTSWLLDSYNQNVLALKALQLAVEFLRPNGWFITKLFRAKDYFSFCWVAQQFFKQIHTTKPSASRLESSEIFVVCQGFLTMQSFDPRFFDEKFVYKEVQHEKPLNLSVNTLFPKSTKRKPRNREGYPDNVTVLFKRLSAKEFIESDNFVSLLNDAYEIEIDDDKIKNHPATTSEVCECIKDVKILGKREMKGLLVWRNKIRQDMHNPAEMMEVEDVPDAQMETTNDMDEDQEIDNLLLETQDAEKKLLKRKRKKLSKQKQKHRTRLALKMINPGDQFDIQNDHVFSARQANKLKEAINAGQFEAFTQMIKDGKKPYNSSFDSEDWFKKASIDIGAKYLVDGIDELLINEAVGFSNDEESESDDEDDNVGHNITTKQDGRKKREVPLSAEELALAHVMKQDSKSREEVIDNAYNKFTGYGDTEGLPGWFVEDEEKHCRKPIEAPEELVSEYKERIKSINARPIKKVLEAKQRKQARQIRASQRLMKRVDALPETLEPVERQKRIEELYKATNQAQKKKKSVALVVAGTGTIPKKGRYKFVDKRMKKDKRGEAKARMSKYRRRK